MRNEKTTAAAIKAVQKSIKCQTALIGQVDELLNETLVLSEGTVSITKICTPLEQNSAALAAILCRFRDSSGLPWIGENGNWWIGDIDTGIEATPDNKPVIGDDGCWVIGGVNTGIPADASLPEGIDVPCIGDNGNWWVGDIDTGIEAKPGDRPTLTDDGTISINGTDTGIRPLPSERAYYSISYITEHGTAPESKSVKWGHVLTADELPVLLCEGYKHGGWLRDSALVKAGHKIFGDTVLTALWYDTEYDAGYAAGYAQAQTDGVSSGAHPSDSSVSVPVYRALYINVTTDSATGSTVYQIEEKGQRWELLADSKTESYRVGYEAGYKYGYKYASQLNGSYLEALEYIWDEPTATLTVEERVGSVSELPENTYTQEG